MLTFVAKPPTVKAGFIYHFWQVHLPKLGLLSILVTLFILSSQLVHAQCTTKVTVTPGPCHEATNTYATTAVVTLTNPVVGILTITDGTQSTTQITTSSSSTFTALFTGLVSNGNSHTVTASLSGCNSSIATYTAPGSCTQPVGTQLSLTKLVDKAKAKIGDVMNYTLVLTNTGSTTATNIVVRDSLSTGLTFVTGSATAPTGTTLTQSTPVSAWKVASLSANQSFSLAYQATADSSGVLYSQATIPGDTATACTSIPVLVCTGDVYTFRLTAKSGRSSYRWFKDNVELTTQTTNTLDITAPGTYSLAVDNVSGKCPDFSCCPFIVEEDTLPTFKAIATPATCLSSNVQATGQIVLSNFRSVYTYQYSLGTDFNPSASLSGAAKVIPTGGVIVNNLANPVTAQSYTVRVYNASGCYTDVTVVLLPAVCCNVSVVANTGSCTPITNTYSTTALISLTNPVAGTLTLTNGPKSLTFATTAGSSVTFAATFDNLISDGAVHTILASLPGCSTASTTYTAPVSCSVGVGLAVLDPGVCIPGTNTYTTSGSIRLTNAVSGLLTIADGASTTTLSVSAGTSSIPYSMSGLPSGTGSHTVIVSYLGQTASTTYTAPASCSVASVCSINTVITPGICSTATNTYSASAQIILTNPTAGLLTVSTGGQSLTFATTLGSSVTFVASFSNLISDGSSHIVVASLPGCSTTSTAYTAPASCIAGVGLAVTDPGVCIPGANTYTTTGIISLTNAIAGSLTITDGASTTILSVGAGASSVPYSLSGLPSGTGLRTVTVSYLGQIASTTYTAPASCSVACSLTAVATATPVTCSGAMALQNGKITISGFSAGDTYQYSGGVMFNPAVSLSGSVQAIPTGGVIVSNLANPVAAQAYTVRIYTASGCYKDSTVLLVPSVCECPVNACVPLVVKQTRGVRRSGSR